MGRGARAEEYSVDTFSVGVDPRLAAYAGKPITRFDLFVDGQQSVPSSLIHSVQIGAPFSPSAGRKALADLLASGKFANGSVGASPEGGGVAIILRLASRKIVQSLKIEIPGGERYSEQLLRSLGLRLHDEFVPGELEKRIHAAEAYLVTRGFSKAQVIVSFQDLGNPVHVAAVVTVVLGTAEKFVRRSLEIQSPDAAAAHAICETYSIGEGDPDDSVSLDAADAALLSNLQAGGYLDATVTHDVTRGTAGLVLNLHVDAGSRYVAKFAGNLQFDDDTLSSVVDMGGDSDRTLQHLAQKVKDFYIRRGFLDVEVTVSPRGTGDDPIRYLFFSITENARVRVTNLAYPCFNKEQTVNLEYAPRSLAGVSREIDSFLQEQLPSANLLQTPTVPGVDALTQGEAPVPGESDPSPLKLTPSRTYVASIYDDAVTHLQELYQSEGFLSARVGPVQVIRRQCAPKSPPGFCIPMPPPPLPDACLYDATYIPLPYPSLPTESECKPDPVHQISCEAQVSLRVPIRLGPRSSFYDIVFRGVKSISPASLGAAAALPLGSGVSMSQIDDASRRIAALYREDGYAYVAVKSAIVKSPDNLRVRVEFDVSEGEQVIVDDITIAGNRRTHESVIRRRLALKVGQPYKTSDVRKTQERIATLNVFSTVNVVLAEPNVPLKRQRVVITVAERNVSSVEFGPGISTGEGFRAKLDYDYRNLFGSAIGFAARNRVSYLPDFLIFDSKLRQKLKANHYDQFDKRIVIHANASLLFPEIGLGPLVRWSFDASGRRDLLPDFALQKWATSGTAIYSPARQWQFSFTPFILERNNVDILNPGETIEQIYANLGNNVALRRILPPEGTSYVVAQRLGVVWDRRDDAFNPTRGTYLAASVEHVDSTPEQPPDFKKRFPGHFLRFMETIGGYIPIYKKLRFALQVRLGQTVQLTSPVRSRTYPDRLFFLGGSETLRGYFQDSLMPQDIADQIARTASLPDGAPGKVTVADIALRGGNLMINPRAELRIPIREPIETVLFCDSGNIWSDPNFVYDNRGPFVLRASVGTGLRIQTPIFPIAIDYGINVTRRRWLGEEFGALSFAIGLF